ncbi:hypothetical protein HK096_008609, partial [Nowakowskiella sp. JEL0078]
RGIGFTGSTTCIAGAVCIYSNAYYSQCLAGSATATKTTTTTKALATTKTTTTTSGSTATTVTLPSTSSRKIVEFKSKLNLVLQSKIHSWFITMFYITASSSGGYNMGYVSFSDWSKVSSATQKTLSTTTIGSGYKTAPQIFYHTPSKLWCLVYQDRNAEYSTNLDITNVNGWSATKNFYSSIPSIVSQNIGSGSWLDFWVICNTSKCYLFSSDDNSHLYQSETLLISFPNGFGQPIIALSDSNKFNLFEASNMYYVQALVNCKGNWFKWLFLSLLVSSSYSGPYTALAATESNPFAGKNNLAFSGAAWTNSISSGGLIPDTYDVTQTISACGMHLAF